ncbi:MAG: heavy metal-binding domain-containing protein [Shewanella sp.]
MKTLTNLALMACLLTSTSVFATATQHQHDNAHSQQQAQTYVCPMHPEVTGSKEDTCPQCGMYLAPKVTAEKSAADTHAACASHTTTLGGR